MGGGKGTNTTTSNFKPPEAFMKAYKESLGMARDAANQPYQQYKGDLVAGLTPTQRQGIANVNAAQGMALPAIQQGMDYTQQAARGITRGLYNKFYSPYVRDVADTTFANLMESQGQQQSALKSGAVQAGAFGGDRGGVAQAEMARQQQLGNAMAMSNIYNQGYGQAMGLAGQQVANLGAMGQQMAALGAGAQGSVLQGAQAQMAAGAQQQATKQAELQAAYDQFMQRQAYPYQQAQFFANIAQGLGAGAGGTSSTTQPSPNIWSQILGGVGAIGSIYSDKRLKENIEAVGKLNDGQTIYRYNFKGDPKTQIGLLAQEVEEQKPGAVTQVKGLKMVDYRDATEDAAKMSSMGGVVAPGMDRQGLAGGGIPFYPYEDARTYVPEGKIGSGGDTIAKKAPTGSEAQGLSKGWSDIAPISAEQGKGLRALARDVGLDLPSSSKNKEEGSGRTEIGDWTYGLLARPESPVQTASGGVVGYANGGTAARHTYADGGAEEVPEESSAGLAAAPEPEPEKDVEFSYPSPEEVEAFIVDEAARRNIDPATAVKVWRSEGATGDPREAWQSKVINKSGKRERSYGPYQLYMKGGLGNEMVKATGLSPEDPRNWKPSVEFALDQAATGGWNPWYGAKKVGVESRTGLSGAKPISKYSPSATGIVPASVSSDDEGLGATTAPESGNFVVKGQKPGFKLGLGKLLASEENPSLIERVMGRRLSPEARAAVMNASFALMAGRSPNFLTNLGEAGGVGAQVYYNALGESKKAAEEQRKLEEENIRKQQIEEAISQLPADQQALARISPDKFFGAKAQTMFATPDTPSLIQEYLMAKKEGFTGTLADWKQVGASSGGKSFAPIPYTRADGTIGYGIPRDDGTFVDVQSPEGAQFLSPFEKARQGAAGAAEGKTTTEQILSAPSDVAAAEQALSVIDQIVEHPYLETGTGFSSYGNVIRGTGGYDFQNIVDQAKSGAFLTAIEQLRGMGALSNAEGQAATSAVTRMDTATSKEAFLKAVSDYRAVVEAGKNRALAKLKAAGQVPPPSIYDNKIPPNLSGDDTSVQKVDSEIIESAVEQLNEKFPDANSGSMKYLKVGDKQLKFVKTTEGWVAAQ